jgi:hypothetical protein
MLTRPTRVKIKEVFPVHHGARVSIQKILVTEPEQPKPGGGVWSEAHNLSVCVLNEAINQLDGLAPGDHAEIICYINGKETFTVDGIRHWTDLRLKKITKLF